MSIFLFYVHNLIALRRLALKVVLHREGAAPMIRVWSLE